MKKMIHYISLLGAFLLLACTADEPETIEEIVYAPVHVMEVRERQKEERHHLIGTIEINHEMKVGFKLGGKITRLSVKEGQSVQKNTFLAQLDTKELLAQKEKALESQSKAKRDLERMKQLFHQKIVSESSLQDAQSAYNLSNAELKIVEDALKNSRITAPFSGKIIKKFAEEGEVVGPGTPIAVLAEMDPILIKAAIPDYLIPKINIGDTVTIKGDWDPNKHCSGVIHRIESVADPITRTIRIEILAANPHETLKPGLMAQIEVTHKENEAHIYLPLDAVIGLGKEPYVFVVQDLHAEKRNIKTGRVIQEELQIIEGLTPGETVVISGQEYLRDQQRVTIQGRSELIQ